MTRRSHKVPTDAGMQRTPEDNYIRKAELIRVIDGDTVELRVDLGFRTSYTGPFRLARINAPKLGDADGRGVDAAVALSGLLTSELFSSGTGVSKHIWIRSHKRGKFRYLAEIYVAIDGGIRFVSDVMVSLGHAKYWSGYGPKPGE